MAICAPGPTPVLIQNTLANEGDEFAPLTSLLRAEDLKRVKSTDWNYPKYAAAKIAEVTKTVFGLGRAEDVVKFLEAQGFRVVDEAATKAARELDPRAETVWTWGKGPAFGTAAEQDERAQWMAVALKNYIDANSQGTRQLAENLLNKASQGEDVLAEGLAFASQMRHLGNVGGYILGWDQSQGRGLMVQGMKGKLGTSQLASGPLTELQDINSWEAFLRSKSDPGAYADQFKLIIDKLNDPMLRDEGLQDLIKMARRVQFSDNPLQTTPLTFGMKFANKMADFIMYNGLLSGPATITTNMASATWVVARAALQLGAAHVYAMTGLPGQAGAREAIVESAAALGAMNTSYKDALAIFWQGARTGKYLYSEGELGPDSLPINSKNAQAMLDQFNIDSGGKDQFYKTVDMVGSFLSIPTRLMAATDDAAKHIAIRGKVAAMGLRRALDSGMSPLDDVELTKFIDEFTANAFGLRSLETMEGAAKRELNREWLGEEAFNEIMREAEQATFQEFNGLAEKVRGIQQIPGMRPFIPFIRTPLNILRQGFVESTGLGAMWKVFKASKEALGDGADPALTYLDNVQRILAKEYTSNPAAAFRVAGQIGLTSALVATVYSMAMDGQIIGGGPARWNAEGRSGPAQKAWDRMIREQGLVPYSIGGVSFERFGEPLAIVMRMAADMAMHSSYVKHEEAEEWLAATAGIMVSSLYNATFFTGLENFMNMVRPGSAENLGGPNGGKAIQNYVRAFTPFGGALNYVDKVIDPNRGGIQKDVSALQMLKVWENTFTTGILAGVADRIPGMGTVPQLVDQLTGQPVAVYPGGGPEGLNPLQMAIPFLPRGGTSQAGPWQAVWDIAGQYQEARPDFPITLAEQQEYNRFMAAETIGGKTVSQAIQEYSQRPEVLQYLQERGKRSGVGADIYSRTLRAAIAPYADRALERLRESSPSVETRWAINQKRKQAQELGDQETAQGLSGEVDRLYRMAF